MSRVAVVTGANRGLGLGIARGLTEQGLRVVVTARDEEAARIAARDLGADAHQLDVTDQASVDRLYAWLDREHKRLDVLVNNAGILLDDDRDVTQADLELVRRTVETNVYGAWRMALGAVSLMRRHGYGRIVNVSSGMGGLTEMSNGRTPAYRLSKAALNTLTRMLATELEGTGILVNSACPGYVRTDMTGPRAPRSVEEGADTPVWLATLPDDGPTGGFFRNREALAF